MAKKEKTKFITPDIMKSSIIGAFQKLDPRYMIKNPVMFVVELGFFITLVLTIFPTLFGEGGENRIEQNRCAMACQGCGAVSY